MSKRMTCTEASEYIRKWTPEPYKPQGVVAHIETCLAVLRSADAKLAEYEGLLAKLAALGRESCVCSRCEGNGAVYADGKAHYMSEHAPSKPCPECDGSGKHFGDMAGLWRLASEAAKEAERG